MSKLTSQTLMSNCRKPLVYFLRNTYSCKNILQIFFNFIVDIKKCFFDVHFNGFTYQIWLRRHTSSPQLSFAVHKLRSPKGGRTAIIMWSAVWRGANHHSYLLPIWRQTECGMCWVLSWVCSHTLSNWAKISAPFWANFHNLSTLLHSLQQPREISLDLGKAGS